MKKICPICKKEFESKTRSSYCCREHLLIAKSMEKYPDGSEYIECKICKLRASDLHKHITRHHKISVKEYCEQFGIEERDLQTDALREHNAEMQRKAYKEGRLQGWGKGDANPSRRKDVLEGRKSIFSMNYAGYDGLTDEEKRNKINTILKDLAKKKKENSNNPLTVEYYIKRGATEEEAKQFVHERQCTFSLDRCIERYGEEEGKRIFEERQVKWQNTLNSKPIEEIERINRAKATASKFICSYSKISQKLFNEIFELIKNDYSEIFYATHGENTNSNENLEYEVILEDNIHRYFLDFYVKDNNKVIEFDGDYWHGERRGNQERDAAREEHLKKLGFSNILHVRERDYLADPATVIKKCLAFIRE